MDGLEKLAERDVGDSIRIEYPITVNAIPFSDNWGDADLDSSSIVISDYEGEEIVNDSLTKNKDGEYYFEWETEDLSPGDFKVKVVAEADGKQEVEKGFIRLV